jgi:hypothetical protein
MVPRKERFSMESLDNLRVVEVGFPEKCCDHGRCLDHSPDWYYLGDSKLHLMELKLNPLERLFNFLRWLFGGAPLIPILHNWGFDMESCCGHSLVYCMNVKSRSCKKCGRSDDENAGYYFYCLCCGYKKSTQLKPHDLSIFQFRYLNSDKLNSLLESRGLAIKVTDEALLLRHFIYSFGFIGAFIYIFLHLINFR